MTGEQWLAFASMGVVSWVFGFVIALCWADGVFRRRRGR